MPTLRTSRRACGLHTVTGAAHTLQACIGGERRDIAPGLQLQRTDGDISLNSRAALRVLPLAILMLDARAHVARDEFK